MIYKTKFILKNIRTDVEDPWELHFKVVDIDEFVDKLLKEDFVFSLKNKWVVSAGGSSSRYYVRGSNKHKEGDKKYFNEEQGECFYKKEFNRDLLELCPNIKSIEYEGEFNTENREMKILLF